MLLHHQPSHVRQGGFTFSAKGCHHLDSSGFLKFHDHGPFCSLRSSHSGFSDILQTRRAHSCLRAFALALLSTWDMHVIFPCKFFPCIPFSNGTVSMRPTLMTFKITLCLYWHSSCLCFFFPHGNYYLLKYSIIDLLLFIVCLLPIEDNQHSCRTFCVFYSLLYLCFQEKSPAL